MVQWRHLNVTAQQMLPFHSDFVLITFSIPEICSIFFAVWANSLTSLWLSEINPIEILNKRSLKAQICVKRGEVLEENNQNWVISASCLVFETEIYEISFIKTTSLHMSLILRLSVLSSHLDKFFIWTWIQTVKM